MNGKSRVKWIDEDEILDNFEDNVGKIGKRSQGEKRGFFVGDEGDSFDRQGNGEKRKNLNNVVDLGFDMDLSAEFDVVFPPEEIERNGVVFIFVVDVLQQLLILPRIQLVVATYYYNAIIGESIFPLTFIMDQLY